MDKDTFKIASIYIGTVIGAGFASGREIIDFFGIYGLKGILGMLLSGFLFAFIGSFLLSNIYDRKIKSYEELLNYVFGEKVKFVIDTIVLFSLCAGFCIMLSGSGAIFEEEFNIPADIGIFVMTICCFVVFLFGIKGFSLINSILIPGLILGIVFIGGKLVIKEGFNFSNVEGISVTNKGNFITSSFLYVSFNSLLLIVVFSNLLSIIPNRKVAIKGGSLGGITLGILGCFILIPLLILYTQVSDFSIPILKVCDYENEIYRAIFSIILWIAMFTTAIANGFCFLERNSNKNKKFVVSIVFCLISAMLARVGFSKLVANIYPVLGYLGGIILIMTIFRLN